MEEFPTEERCKVHFKVQRERDALYRLEGMIEFDESYFEKATSEKLKRGRGSQKQINVAVMAESTPPEDLETRVQSSQCRYFKMKVPDNYKADLINETISDSFSEMSIVFSDKSTGYMGISEYGDVH